jgi:adenylate kinase family enzyme
VSFRVHIVGASGSGTTTLGRALAAQLGVRHFDTDDYYWLPTDPPYREKRPIEERLARLEPLLRASESWVLSGSLVGWGDPLIPYFDLVVFLAVPQEVRLARLRERERRRYGESAIRPGGSHHEKFREFLDWARSYDEGDLDMRSRARHEQWLGQLETRVLRLEEEEPVAAQIRAILDLRG